MNAGKKTQRKYKLRFCKVGLNIFIRAKTLMKKICNGSGGINWAFKFAFRYIVLRYFLDSMHNKTTCSGTKPLTHGAEPQSSFSVQI